MGVLSDTKQTEFLTTATKSGTYKFEKFIEQKKIYVAK